MKFFIQISLFAILLTTSQKCGNDRVHQQQDIERTERWRKHLRDNGVFSAPVQQPKGRKEVQDV